MSSAAGQWSHRGPEASTFSQLLPNKLHPSFSPCPLKVQTLPGVPLRDQPTFGSPEPCLSLRFGIKNFLLNKFHEGNRRRTLSPFPHTSICVHLGFHVPRLWVEIQGSSASSPARPSHLTLAHALSLCSFLRQISIPQNPANFYITRGSLNLPSLPFLSCSAQVLEAFYDLS